MRSTEKGSSKDSRNGLEIDVLLPCDAEKSVAGFVDSCTTNSVRHLSKERQIQLSERPDETFTSLLGL